MFHNTADCHTIVVVGPQARTIVNALVRDICPGFYARSFEKDDGVDFFEIHKVGPYTFLTADRDHDYRTDPEKQAQQLEACKYADMAIVALDDFTDASFLQIGDYTEIFKLKMAVVIAADGSKPPPPDRKYPPHKTMPKFTMFSTVYSFNHAVKQLVDHYMNHYKGVLEGVKEDWIDFLDKTMLRENLCLCVDDHDRPEVKLAFSKLNEKIGEARRLNERHYRKCVYFKKNWEFIRDAFEQLENAMPDNHKGCFDDAIKKGDTFVSCMPSLVFPDGYI